MSINCDNLIPRTSCGATTLALKRKGQCLFTFFKKSGEFTPIHSPEIDHTITITHTILKEVGKHISRGTKKFDSGIGESFFDDFYLFIPRNTGDSLIRKRTKDKTCRNCVLAVPSRITDRGAECQLQLYFITVDAIDFFIKISKLRTHARVYFDNTDLVA